TLSNVVLSEVTIDDNDVSTPVEGGECLTIPSFSFDLANWTCPESWYQDGACDCGCGSVDLDCADATSASCDFCQECGPSCDDVDPDDNSQCLP
ncbi:MAG TPA: hypothetical protein VGK73_30790, partial [Polyangiaceae bacterium]